MSDVQPSAGAPKKERSPSFPYIGLSKALERARQVYNHAKRHEARTADVAAAWDLGAKSSATMQTIGALIAFGLLEDSGSGESRKFKISDLAFKALEDQRPGAKESALAQAATKPKLLLEYIEKWKDGRPADGICISELRIDRGFTDDGARAFLRVFDDTVTFVATEPSAEKADEQASPSLPKVKIGEFVQWTSQGVDQLLEPAEVVTVSEDGEWLWVAGESKAGIPVAETRVVGAPEKKAHQKGGSPLSPAALVATKPNVAGIREEKFALSEGDVVIQFPVGLSMDSVDDLEAYLQIFLKKARREATALSQKA